MSCVVSGQRLDHYQLESVVSHSGMATIVKATDLRNRLPVALKIPHLEAENDPGSFARFQREEWLCQKLDHPGIVKAYKDEGRSRVYIVMEWVEGKLLRQILAEEHRLPAERAVQIALRICEPLEYIHGNGVVHRDLKPENVVVGTGDKIKLIDFGIAHSTGLRRLTFDKLSSALGTPDYISPEQVNGARGDARSDLYALGIMLYEMLTGQVPFPGENPLVAMNARLLHNARPPRELDATISPQLDSIICRCLERDPNKRYSSVEDFAWELQHQNQGGVRQQSDGSNGKTAIRQIRAPRLRKMLSSFISVWRIPALGAPLSGRQAHDKAMDVPAIR